MAGKKRGSNREIGEDTNRANESENNCRYSNVIVLDVSELVSHDSLELLVIHDGQQTGGGCNDGILGVSPGRKGVWCWVLDDVNLGHGHALANREVLDNAP